MKWDAWGLAEKSTTLSDGIKGLLQQALGVTTRQTPERAAEDVVLAASAVSEDQLAALAAIVGERFCSTAHYDRLLRSGGKSTIDLLRRRSTEQQNAPDVVVIPGTEAEIAEILDYCADNSIAVVPFSGGSSAVGGLDPVRDRFDAVLSLDMRRFDSLIDLDTDSGIATLGAGLPGPRVEERLGAHGFSLGHFPQSFMFSTIGGFAATRSSGQSSAGYGRFEDMVQGLRVVTPAGILDTGRAPASAAGPDLGELFVGSEGTLGVITQVRVRVHPVPESVVREGWRFPDFETGTAALRALRHEGAVPTVLRLSDEAETGVNLATHDKIGKEAVTGGCLAITTFEGTTDHTAQRVAQARAVLQSHGATSLGEGPGNNWERGRFDAPYLRDALLDAGALVETLETATTWSNLATLRAAVTKALTESLSGQGTPPLVLCHISHTYATGASLYFTIVCAQKEDPIDQWSKAKTAAGDAIIAAGGTITHHHAVGVDHRPWMRDEIGDLGVTVLRAVKNAVDPAGILNPGKLIP
ncbi:FAD-binding oxidoreductase [Rhodococcus spongiicola]|uniref:FAD-binding oxidoreductase n=2 Tax=Rhodococcus spongiicola TaxID=2487352 RepID=A0A3S3AAI6_9NOCA|nr:FAD-binding oxidoreductase [Rhodococcus spongiicola]RVW03524.1 FAD-binding oxidoreductase [Rhodococcus spongiicola]